MNRCGSSCHSRGICSNGRCVCSNRTYAGDACEMCQLSDTMNVGCFYAGNDSQPSCMCYLSSSKTRRTPYLCSIFKNEREEIGKPGWSISLCIIDSVRFIEVPCDRIAMPVKRESCSRSLFPEPLCGESSHSLIFHVEKCSKENQVV